ncbi:MAG TPA: MmgE/PrpD family protein [Dehalococcoidia bacterium]|nr:MmgE/PrpD family protein [Dehalococcoidia bacterium]
MSPEMPPVTRDLARFVIGLRYADLRPELTAMARSCLIDWLGIAIAGSRQPLAPILETVVDQLGGHSQATVVGTGRRTSTAQAALLNATFAHSLDYDDVHHRSGVHASAPVWAAALAIAEWRGLSAQAAMVAFVAGYEVMARIGRTVGMPMIQAHHHPTGVLGYYGAATAAGRLLDLDEEGLARAYGIAAGQAGALIQVRGTMSKPFFAGHAAHGGVLSALMAAAGFESVTDAIEGPEGVVATFGQAGAADRILRDLGERWELLTNSFKAYAACAMTHPMLDGLLEIREEVDLDPAEIEEIRVGLYPYATEYVNRREVQTGLAGKFSAQYCAAVAVLDGQAQEPQFTDARAADPELARLMDRVRLVPVETYPMTESEVEVRLRDGRVVSRHVATVTGSPSKPLRWEDLSVKFRGLAQLALPPDRVLDLLERLDRWPEVEIPELLALAEAG